MAGIRHTQGSEGRCSISLRKGLGGGAEGPYLWKSRRRGRVWGCRGSSCGLWSFVHFMWCCIRIPSLSADRETKDTLSGGGKEPGVSGAERGAGLRAGSSPKAKTRPQPRWLRQGLADDFAAWVRASPQHKQAGPWGPRVCVPGQTSLRLQLASTVQRGSGVSGRDWPPQSQGQLE